MFSKLSKVNSSDQEISVDVWEYTSREGFGVRGEYELMETTEGFIFAYQADSSNYSFRELKDYHDTVNRSDIGFQGRPIVRRKQNVPFPTLQRALNVVRCV